MPISCGATFQSSWRGCSLGFQVLTLQLWLQKLPHHELNSVYSDTYPKPIWFALDLKDCCQSTGAWCQSASQPPTPPTPTPSNHRRERTINFPTLSRRQYCHWTLENIPAREKYWRISSHLPAASTLSTPFLMMPKMLLVKRPLLWLQLGSTLGLHRGFWWLGWVFIKSIGL